jgi:hypothetical protein
MKKNIRGVISLHRWTLVILILGAFAFSSCAANLNFNDLVVGTKYSKVNDTMTTSGTEIYVLRFQWSNLNWTSDGYAEVVNSNLAGGTDKETFINNVNLGFNLNDASAITFSFRDKGGNINISVNNDFKNIQDFIEINNTTVGGVNVTIESYDPQNNMGIVRLSGKMSKFKFDEKQILFLVGGQELYIDDLKAE